MNNMVVTKKPSIRDIESISERLGPFPASAIESHFKEKGIGIAVDAIPKGFEKYLGLMQSVAVDLREKNLVDFGCGLGVFVAQASRLGMRAEGLDIFAEYGGECLNAAQCIVSSISPASTPKLTRVDFLAEAVDRNADFVTSFGMLEHIHGREARRDVIGKMMNALRPGGHLILTCGPNRRFPIDLHHYGPAFVFYHWLSVGQRRLYLRLFARPGQNRDPKWLNGLTVAEVRDSIFASGGEAVEQVFPLWVELARSNLLRNRVIRRICVAIARFFTRIEAEPVILVVARKRCTEARATAPAEES